MEISDKIISPLASIIRRKHHIVFSVAQPLTAFPFGALIIDDQPLALTAAVSVTPSLATYHQLSAKTPVFAPTVTTIAKPGSKSIWIRTGERPLPMAGIEAIVISRLFHSKPRLATKMSRGTFCTHIGRRTIMHISTHGVLDTRSPWLSYISLKEKMRVIDLVQVKSRAALIVFAACLSGLGQATIGNDVLGFSHAVLEAGATAYMGALWMVDDVATMILMVLFYRNMWERQSEGLAVAELWRKATVEFYHLDTESAKQILNQVGDELKKAKDEGANPNQIVQNVEQELLTAKKRLNIDFKHPFYWASFVLVGYGALICQANDSKLDEVVGATTHS